VSIDGSPFFVKAPYVTGAIVMAWDDGYWTEIRDDGIISITGITTLKGTYHG
jgi:hypothetical protein